MTDKQIIVEVKCPWFNDGSCDLFYSDKEECWYRQCKDTPNCYYRETQTQLKAKEQELQEAMDNYVKLDNQRVKEYNELVDKYNNKEQECEFSNLRIIQLQETLSQYETDLSTKDCIVETCKAQYKELKAENEKLDTENKRLVAELANPVFDSFEELDKLKQTLTEIKEIVYELTNEEYTDFIEGKQKQILQKISECEGNDELTK